MNKKLLVLLILFLLVFTITGCNKTYTSILSVSDFFDSEDLKEADMDSATKYSVNANQDITINEAGTYLITGSASATTVIVDAGSNDLVRLVLSDLSITNLNKPCIYVKSAKKVIVTLDGDNFLIVSADFDSNDAVIFSKNDIVFNGSGNLDINSSNNGISSKDNLIITGGTFDIVSSNDGLEANNSIAIKAGVINIDSGKDGLQVENSKDDSAGDIYIGGGVLTIKAADDALHVHAVLQIDSGVISTDSREGLEGTYIQINGGTIDIKASDDGMNGARKSDAYTTTIEINGGAITIVMGKGDTDGIDSNGNLYINGGTIDITADSPFDYDDNLKYSGGKIIVNGEETNEVTNQTFGGPPQK